jgi:hypothetical protein
MLANNYKQCVICKEDNGPLLKAFVKKENALLTVAAQNRKATRNAKSTKKAHIAFFEDAGMSQQDATFFFETEILTNN